VTSKATFDVTFESIYPAFHAMSYVLNLFKANGAALVRYFYQIRPLKPLIPGEITT